MTVATVYHPVSGFSDRTSNPWKPRGAVIALLIVMLAVMALAGQGKTAGCEVTQLTIAELTLPDLTHPA